MAYNPKAGAVMPPPGQDWNDLLSSKGQAAGKYFADNRPEYEFQARLALAESAQAYAETFFDFRGYLPGLFAFDGSYYSASIKKAGRDEVVITNQHSNFILEVDHFQLNTSIHDRPEYLICLTIIPKSGPRTRFVASAEELAQPGQMTKMFLQRANVLWTGERKPTMQLIKKIVESMAPVVRQVQTIGYDAESGCYVYRHFMIRPAGETVLPNEKGFFEVGRRKYIRPPSSGVVDKLVKPVRGEHSIKDLYGILTSTWGPRAAVGVAWMIGSWFVHDISRRLGFYPFLSFYGDTHTGKSSLIHFMQLMQSVDAEGMPMTKTNTSKGRIRELAQRSSLFHAMLEANAGESARLDFDQFLTLYNFSNLQTRAKKTTGLEVETIPFRSALLFGQNFEAFTSKAMRERVVSAYFPADEVITESSKATYDRLKAIPRPEWAMVLPTVLRHRQAIESKWFEYWDNARRLLSGNGNTRVEENHAFLLTFHWLFCALFQIQYDLEEYVMDLTKAKIREVEHRPAGLADFFFDVVFDLVPKKWNDARRVIDWPGLKDDRADSEPPPAGQLAFNLNGVMDLYGQFRTTVKDLQTALREHPAYVDSNKPHRFWREVGEAAAPKKAWVFDLAKIPRAGEDPEEENTGQAGVRADDMPFN
jgi:hypothetical protein